LARRQRDRRTLAWLWRTQCPDGLTYQARPSRLCHSIQSRQSAKVIFIISSIWFVFKYYLTISIRIRWMKTNWFDRTRKKFSPWLRGCVYTTFKELLDKYSKKRFSFFCVCLYNVPKRVGEDEFQLISHVGCVYSITYYSALRVW
jgi:hypothetical protein